MSYQIKSTPYFQRMLTKSKRNGELQRLREEYERVKEFSDHVIATRIRQVRLRRLFREIEQINAEAAARARPRRRLPKTYAQRRAEELSRARDLGTEYSRENALNVQRFGPHPSLLSVEGRKLDFGSKASSTAKRITYGNQISNFNMKMFSRRRRHELLVKDEVFNDLRSASSVAMDGVEKLRQQVDYKDSKKSLDEAKPKRRSRKHSSSVTREERLYIDQESNSPSKFDERSSEALFDQDTVKNYTLVLDEDNSPATGVPLEDPKYGTEASSVRPRRHKHHGKHSSRHSRRTHREEEELMTEDFRKIAADDDHDDGEEFKLRKIDNDRNLPLSQIGYNPGQSSIPIIESNEDVGVLQNEQLLKISNLSADPTISTEDNSKKIETYWKKPSVSEPAVSKHHHMEDAEAMQATALANTSLRTKPLANIEIAAQQQRPVLLQTHVKEFVKRYEPFPREGAESGQTKGNFEPEFARLRSVFEHQGE